MTGDSLDDLPLSLMQKVLLATDGTVTDLVALFSGEPIHITKLCQEVIQTKGPEALQLAAPESLLKRVVLLSSERQHHLYAESYFVIGRMAPSMQAALLETETPIGLLWKEARLEMYREVVERKLENKPTLLDYFPDTGDERFLSRTYVIYHQQKPLGIITEKFPYHYFTNTVGLPIWHWHLDGFRGST
jgi:chorismate-pyruvate lyase